MGRAATTGQAPKRGGTDLRPGLVVRGSRQALLFFDDKATRQWMVPFKCVKDWYFTASGLQNGLKLEHLELNDEVTLELPRWLLIKEGLV